MLQRISIENIALISKLEIDFGQGFNVFTGETGAGKSIIIDSVNLVLGERADRDMIKHGCEKAIVEALFTVDSAFILDEITKLDIECCGELVLYRELNVSGKNICKINGRLSNLTILQKISDLLVDIHGQHEHQSLLNNAVQMQYIDAFGGSDIGKLLEAYHVDLEELWSIDSLMHQNSLSPAEIERRIDILQYQISEIYAANLQSGEEEQLKEQRELLTNSEKISNALNNAYNVLYSNDKSGLGSAKLAMDTLSLITEFSADYQNINNKLSEAFYLLEDVCIELRSVKDSVDFNPSRLETIEERLDLIKKLKRKYGDSIDEVLSFLQDAQSQLGAIEDAISSSKELQSKRSVITKALYSKASALSSLRKKAAEEFSKKLLIELKDLALEKANFHVAFSELPSLNDNIQFTSTGLDSINMMISTNPGEPLKQIDKIASGGEISRIMLAFKSILSESDSIPCLIFDEIDTGISGKTAAIVGEKMRLISREHQVICVTHSPQIAAMADYHYLIEKHEVDGRFETCASQLGADARIEAIACMLSNESVSETALQLAKKLIEH